MLTGISTFLILNTIQLNKNYQNLDEEYSQYRNNAETRVRNFLAQFNMIEKDDDLNRMLIKAQVLLIEQENRIKFLEKYELRNPTEEELLYFLRMDDTSEQYYNEYDVYTGIEDDFVCLEYATKLYYRAREKGINMSFIASNFKYGDSQWDMKAHAYNSVKLANGTVVYVEPQKDRLLSSPEEVLGKMVRVQIENIRIRNYGELWP